MLETGAYRLQSRYRLIKLQFHGFEGAASSAVSRIVSAGIDAMYLLKSVRVPATRNGYG
jgi:hypothetical protein